MNALSESSPRKKVLFVCTHNEVRSLTAENVYRGRQDLEVRSAGLASHAKNPVTADAVNWADLVVVFEPQHAEKIKRQFPRHQSRSEMVCLKLADKFEYKSPKLVLKLVARLRPYLGEPAPNSEPVSTQHEGSFLRRLVQNNLF